VAASDRRVALLAAGLTLATVALQAENELNVQLHGFHDNRGVTVLSPAVDLTKDFTERTSLRASFGVDAVSAASESCERCHQGGASNQRVHLSGALVRALGASGNTKWSVGTDIGVERFYQTVALTTGLTRTMNKGNTTVAGGFAVAVNRPNLHPEETTENAIEPSGYVTLTQTLTRTTAVQLGYQLDYVSGYQDNPFLEAAVNGLPRLGHSPETRARHALSARLRQALPARASLEADYRRYFDSWSIRSHTLRVGLARHFSDTLLLSAFYRRYSQTGADFYAPSYSGSPLFFTADFRLSPFASDEYGGRFVLRRPQGGLGLPSESALTGEVDVYRADNGFNATILTAGVRVPLK
jgi:hypothetical protein